MKCESCGKEASLEDRFCQKCGGRLTPSHPVVVAGASTFKSDGTAKLQLDSNAVNILLKEFASKDGTDVAYRNGQIVVEQAGMKLTVTELPLKDTKLKLDGKFGTVKLELAEFQLKDDEIALNINVGLD